MYNSPPGPDEIGEHASNAKGYEPHNQHDSAETAPGGRYIDLWHIILIGNEAKLP